MNGKIRSLATTAALACLVLPAVACVHTDVQRVGRQRLGDGREGIAPIIAAVPDSHEEVAEISVEADALVADDARRLRHLQRRASLLGCDALVSINAQGNELRGTCVRRRDPSPIRTAALVQVPRPPADLVRRVTAAGYEGRALLEVLEQVEGLSPSDRAWPIRWYLETYPDSPFRAELEDLLRGRVTTVAMAPRPAVRSAPLSK